MEHRPLTVRGPDLNHEFTALLSITLFYEEILMKFIWFVFFFSSYEMLQTTYVVRKVKLNHSWRELVTLGGDLNQESSSVAPTAVPTMLTPLCPRNTYTPVSIIKSATLLWNFFFLVEGHWVTPHMSFLFNNVFTSRMKKSVVNEKSVLKWWTFSTE